MLSGVLTYRTERTYVAYVAYVTYVRNARAIRITVHVVVRDRNVLIVRGVLSVLA